MKWLKRLQDTQAPSDAALLAVVDRNPWILGCAVMAAQRSDGMSMGFDMWWRLSAENWLDEARKDFPTLLESQLRGFLVRFTEANQHRTGSQVMTDAAQRAGMAPPVVLGPGESMIDDCKDQIIRRVGDE